MTSMYEFTICKYGKNIVTGGVSCKLSTVPSKAFQYVTFTYDDNKHAQYACFGKENCEK